MKTEEPAQRSTPSEPGRIAYAAVLAATVTGTLSSTVINAPLHTIQQEFGASDSKIVLTVSAFTISMVVFVPLMGWLADRFGPIRIVIAGLIVMAAAQAVAAFVPSLEFIIAARAVQGAACSAFPPGVQRALVALWPAKQARALVAWATAIGVGQGLGPPVGGFITELINWRAVFLVQTVVCIIIVVTIMLTVPRVPGHAAPIHGVGMFTLMVVMGASVLAITLAGQRADLLTEAAVIAVATVGLVIYIVLATRYPDRILEPRSLWEKRYIRATAVTGTALFVLGTCMVSLPLFLGRLGMTAGPVGMTVFAMAFAMAVSGPILNRLTPRFAPRTILKGGLAVLIVAPVLLGLWITFAPAEVPVQVPVIVALLLLMGSAITASQSVAAFTISRSPAAKNSMAFGIHNTLRFMGMGAGYAWASLILPFDVPLVLYAGAALVALGALLVTVIGGPAGALPADRRP